MRQYVLVIGLFLTATRVFGECPLITSLTTSTPAEDTGYFTAMIGWSEARVRVIWNGHQDTYYPTESPLVITLSARCMSSPATLEVHAERDFSGCNPDIKTTTVIPPNGTPQITAIRWDPAQEKIFFEYKFPLTEGGGGFRHIDVFLDGHTSPDASMDTYIPGGTGSLHFQGTAEVFRSCWPTGSHPVRIAANSCAGSKTENASLAVDDTPSIKAWIVRNPNNGETRVWADYEFKSPSGLRQMFVDFLPSTNNSTLRTAQVTAELFQRGTVNAAFLGMDRVWESDQIRVRARACGVDEAVAYLNVNPPAGCCKGAPKSAGNPESVSSGEMSYTDGEPLPPMIAPMSRIQHSLWDVQDGFAFNKAAFGNSWVSIFDAMVRGTGGPDGRDLLTVATLDRRYIFRLVSGAYSQAWPMDGIAATLTVRADGMLVLREPNSTVVEVFDPTSTHLVEYRDLATGRATQITYDPNGLPQSVADSWGTVALTVTTDATNRRVTFIAVNGRPDIVWRYNYTGPNLTSVTAPDGQTWRTYTYDGALTSVRDSLGHLIESHQYSYSRAISDIGPRGDFSTIQYAQPGRVPNETYSRFVSTAGKETRYYQQFIGGESRTVEVSGGCSTCGVNDGVFAYDGSGNLVREQDARGYITIQQYDTSGRPSSVSRGLTILGCDPATDPSLCRQTPEALGTATLALLPATTTTTYAYEDPNWPERPTSITTPSVGGGDSRVERFTYEATTGNVTRHEVSGYTGSPAQQETHVTTTQFNDGIGTAPFDPCGGSTCGFSAGWLALPQPSGTRRQFDGPRTDVSDVVQFAYYPIEASVPGEARGRLAATRDAAGRITRFENYDVFGNALRVIDPAGVITDMTADAFGRTTLRTLRGLSGCDTSADPLCATDISSQTAYFPAGSPMSSTTQPGGGTTSYSYDSLSRVQSITRAVAGTTNDRLEYDYDPISKQKSAERYRTNATGSYVTKRSDAFAYDINGRLSQLTHPDNTKILYAYDNAGNVISAQDENHATPNTAYAFDPLGRLQSVTQTLAGAPGGTIITSYAYDTQGNLVFVTDPNGNVTTYAYDDFGRMMHQTSPVTGTTSYAYDPAGNLTSTADANNATTTRTYDATNRVLTADSSRAGATAEGVTWTYEPNTGRVSTMTDPTGSTEYTYDRRGLLLSEQKTIEGNTYTTRFTYDADGNRNSITYPSGRLVTYTFDKAGRPVTAAAGATTLVSGATYLPLGPPSTLTLGNGTTTTRQYDNRYRITENKLTASNGTRADYTYSYDNAGNILTLNDGLDASYNRSFVYDDLNRLTAANSGPSLWGTGSYQYDAMGNMLGANLGASRSASFAYVGNTPKLSSVTEAGATRPVSYDAAGNETFVGSGSFLYTSRNSLQTGDGLGYTYDSRGVRIITTVLNGGLSVVSLSLSPPFVGGQSSSTGTVTLSASAPAEGAIVTLSTHNTAVARPPLMVTVSPGSTTATFTVATSDVATSTSVTIVALLGGSYASATLTVSPPPPSVIAVSLSPARVEGGTSSTGSVTLDRAAPAGGSVVMLTSSDPVASVPASVAVVAGENTATFLVTTSAVTNTTTATITATLTASESAVLTIDPPPLHLDALSVDPSSVVGGRDAIGTVTLNGPALTGGAVVTLSSDSKLAETPPGVVVIEGTPTAKFSITTWEVPIDTSVTITGVYGATRSAALTLQACTQEPATPPISFPPGDSVWFDDSVPGGGVQTTGWAWDTSQKASGTASHTDARGAGQHEHGFSGATQTLTVLPSDALYAYVLIDRCDPPQEIMLEWTAGGSSEHRAYWGTDAINLGTSGTVSRKPMGALPNTGAWVRLEVPASAVGLGVDTVTGMSFKLFGGKAWFDRVGRTICNVAVAASPTLPTGETVWFDDAPPTGAVTFGIWNWDTTQKASGTKSHTEPVANGAHEHGFTGATATLAPAVTDKLFAYALINPCDPPEEIMLEWRVGADAEHRAFWGSDELTAGTAGTASRMSMGSIPTTGQWVRLEVPTESLGLASKSITGTSFKLFGGQAWFDRSGRAACTVSKAAAPTLTTQTIWFEDATPAGAALSGTWTWDTGQVASGKKSHTDGAVAGEHQHSFTNTTAPLVVNAGDRLVAYVMISPCNPPREIMLEWNDGTWEHRAFWGEDLIARGTAGTVSRVAMGALPAAGQWVRLVLPAAAVGLEGRSLNGMSFRMYNGKAWFDRAGKASPGQTSIEPVVLGFSAMFATKNAVSMSSGLQRRYSFYTPELNLLAESELTTSATPATAYEYIWFGGQPVAQFENATSTTSWTFTDHLGTPLLQTDSAANITWRAEHEPYGNVYALRSATDRHQPLRFPGQEAEQLTSGPNGVTERSYNIFRWYRSGWGQYTQPDPDGISRLAEPYGYARKRPLMLTDKYGLNAGTVATPLWNFCETAASQGLTAASAAGAMFIGLMFAATDTSQLADISSAFPTTCQKCGKTKLEQCQDACEKAWEIRWDACMKRYSGNPYLQQQCASKASELNADCMKACYETFGPK